MNDSRAIYSLHGNIHVQVGMFIFILQWTSGTGIKWTVKTEKENALYFVCTNLSRSRTAAAYSCINITLCTYPFVFRGLSEIEI